MALFISEENEKHDIRGLGTDRHRGVFLGQVSYTVTAHKYPSLRSRRKQINMLIFKGIKKSHVPYGVLSTP